MKHAKVPRNKQKEGFSLASKRLIKSSKLAAIPVEGMLAFITAGCTVVTNSRCAFVFLGNTGRSHSSLEQDNHLVRGSYQRRGRVVII